MATHPAFPVDEGIQWAVLSTYARSLYPHPRRWSVSTLAARLRPALGQQGQALVRALDLGYTRGGNITPLGRLAAARYLADLQQGREVSVPDQRTPYLRARMRG